MLFLIYVLIYMIGIGIGGRLSWQYVKNVKGDDGLLVLCTLFWPLALLIIIGDCIGMLFIKLKGEDVKE